MSEVLNTKRIIAQSLKELSETKPFDKISVGEIAAKSNVNRQTFYYHFQDKYDLLKWIYKEDFFLPYLTDISMDNWDTCLEGLLDAISRERAFSINTSRHTEADVKEIFLQDTEAIFTSAIEYLRVQSVDNERTLSLVEEEEQRFIARFFAYGVCGMLIEWIERGMKEDSRTVATRMRMLLDTCKELAYKQVSRQRNENL